MYIFKSCTSNTMRTKDPEMTANILDSIEEVLLMGPGRPSCVPAEVYQALARPTLGHLDPAFIRIMGGIKVQLRQLLQTGSTFTFPLFRYRIGWNGMRFRQSG